MTADPKQLSLFDSTPQASAASGVRSNSALPCEGRNVAAEPTPDVTARRDGRHRAHFSRLENSPALQRILALLRERGSVGATSRELARECEVVAPSTWVSNLRYLGYTIERVAERTTANGSRVNRYRLLESA